jgi:hypothetical protein
LGDVAAAGIQIEAEDAAAAPARESTDVTRMVFVQFTLSEFKGKKRKTLAIYPNCSRGLFPDLDLGCSVVLKIL